MTRHSAVFMTCAAPDAQPPAELANAVTQLQQVPNSARPLRTAHLSTACQARLRSCGNSSCVSWWGAVHASMQAGYMLALHAQCNPENASRSLTTR